jgi:hypothetical protein
MSAQTSAMAAPVIPIGTKIDASARVKAKVDIVTTPRHEHGSACL